MFGRASHAMVLLHVGGIDTSVHVCVNAPCLPVILDEVVHEEDDEEDVEGGHHQTNEKNLDKIYCDERKRSDCPSNE